MADEIKADLTADVKLDAVLDKAATKVNLKDVINKAVDETAKDIKLDKVDEPEVKDGIKKEAPKDIKETKEDKKDDADEFTPDQLVAAKSLFKALNNPNPTIQVKAVELLANAAGLKLADIETKVEAKEAKDAMLELLKTSLGEYEFLADKLAPVLKTAIKNAVEENTKDLKEEAKANKAEKENLAISNAIDKSFNKYTNASTKEMAAEVKSLMDKFTPGKGVTTEQFFDSLIVLAAANKNVKLESPNDSKRDDRINKNRQDAASRLASERGAETKEVVRTAGFKNLKDAVRDAVKQAAEQMTSGNK